MQQTERKKPSAKPLGLLALFLAVLLGVLSASGRFGFHSRPAGLMPEVVSTADRPRLVLPEVVVHAPHPARLAGATVSDTKLD